MGIAVDGPAEGAAHLPLVLVVLRLFYCFDYPIMLSMCIMVDTVPFFPLLNCLMNRYFGMRHMVSPGNYNCNRQHNKSATREVPAHAAMNY